MNFKYYFFALAMSSALLLSACKNNAGTSEPETPVVPAALFNCPDSVYVYSMSASREVLDAVHYYRYDANGNMLLDSTANYKTVRSFDSHNNLLERKDYARYATNYNEWIGGIKSVYTYDEQNKIATLVSIDGFTDDYEDVPTKKAVYTWTDDTHAVSQVSNYRHSNTERYWVPSDRAEFEYTIHGKLLNEKYYFWCYRDTTNVSPMYEILIEYNQYDHAISYKQLVWNLAEDEYNVVNIETYSYDYDEDGNILVKYTYSAITEPILIRKELYYY